jgi:hypothetical protein
MAVPGSNLLNKALSVIARQTVAYYQFTGRVQNEVKQYVATYAAAQPITGSFQPVPRRLYQTYGLDFQKQYINFYTSNNLLDIQRDVSGDQITYCGKRYQVLSATEWANIDGWVEVMCVFIGESDA